MSATMAVSATDPPEFGAEIVRRLRLKAKEPVLIVEGEDFVLIKRAPNESPLERFDAITAKACRNIGIRLRFGAVGRYGSIAIIARFIKSLKNECLRAILIPLRRRDLHHEIDLYVTWYHRHRPHQALGGIVPFERDHSTAVLPATTNIRTPEIAGRDMPLISMQISFLEGRRHLPIVELRKAA